MSQLLRYNDSIPDPAAVTLVSLDGDALPAYGIEIVDDVVNIQAAVPGHWLFRVWFTDGATPTDQETLIPPEIPGASSFFKVTDSSGLCTFTVSNPVASSHYVHAALIGAVATSDTITVGV